MEIKIRVKGSDSRKIDDLVHFQGDLKELTEINYQKLKKEIIELGFCEAVVIWGDKILNGHQRIRTLKRMRDEGFDIPLIPVTTVQADDEKQARRIVLSLTSQFGKLTEESLLAFAKESDINLDEIVESFNFPELNMKRLDDLSTDELKDLTELNAEDDSGAVPNVDMQGVVDGRVEYMILTFASQEEYLRVYKSLNLGVNTRRVEYADFMKNHCSVEV